MWSAYLSGDTEVLHDRGSWTYWVGGSMGPGLKPRLSHCLFGLRFGPCPSQSWDSSLLLSGAAGPPLAGGPTRWTGRNFINSSSVPLWTPPLRPCLSPLPSGTGTLPASLPVGCSLLPELRVWGGLDFWGDTHRLGGACLLPAEAAERPACVPGWRAGSLVRKDVSVLCGTQTPPGMWLWARISLGKKG